MDVIVGTAGHIDHGKTSLVKALTGVDADRLPEEKQRGITIDLGFAELDLGDVRVGFVDVPGHEKFVKNMLAGASGIDLVVLVIAADEGVMPQTREHFEICRLLGVRSGLIVLTKSDLVDEETLELARMEAAELVIGSFLENAPIVEVSSRTGAGMAELNEALHSASLSVRPAHGGEIARLPIDRSFTVKGFGAVVTGTLVSGEIRDGDDLELMPDGIKVRVRGLQTHGKKVDSAHAGQRTAVNLAGVSHSEVHRGMTLCERSVLRPTQVLDTEIEVLKTVKNGLRSRQRVRVHIGTVESLARVSVISGNGVLEPGETGLVQLRLEAPVVAVPEERLILRSYSPQITIAGGRVLDASAEKHRRKDLPAVRERLLTMAAVGEDAQARVRLFAEWAGKNGATVEDLQARTGLRRSVLDDAVAGNLLKKATVDAGERILSINDFRNITAAVTDAVAAFHRRQPLARGISLEALRDVACRHVEPSIFKFVLAQLQSASTIAVDSDAVRLIAHNAELSPAELKSQTLIRDTYAVAGAEVPRFNDVLDAVAAETLLSLTEVRTVFQMFLDSGEIVKITDEFYFMRSTIDRISALLKNFADASPDRLIEVGRFKEIAGVSRKYAIPILEYFDRAKITRRAADKRVVL
ncbi:MAG: selenocysteine-specific translation elongation factor [Acidobacteriota bacterium]